MLSATLQLRAAQRATILSALPRRFVPAAAEASALIKLALPLAATQLASIAVFTTDVLMIGRLGAESLAAATVGVTLYYFAWVVGYGPGAAVSAVVAQALGADRDDTDTPRRALHMGVLACFIMSVPLTGLMLAAEPILLALGQPEAVVARAMPYMWALLPWLAMSLVFTALRSFSSAVDAPRAALVVQVLTIGVNALLNYALIYGELGAPRLEMAGAGLATTGSALFSLLALGAWLVLGREARRFALLSELGRMDVARLAELFRLGIPIGLTMLFEATLFQAGTLIVGTFGANALAAHQIALNVASVTFMVPLGVALAGTVRVGLAAGARRRKRTRLAGALTIGGAAALSLVFAVLMWTVPGPIVGLYLDRTDPANAAVVELAVRLLQIAALFQLFDALQVAGNMALRGLKDARVPMVIAGLSYWGAGMPIAIWLAFGAGVGPAGVWYGFVAGLAAAAVGLGWRFHAKTR